MPHIIGTAGHIDHGKTALIRALTGQETDRLKEEQERGISIDIGFAYMDLTSGERVGIVDVPGHERFIRNMLAGAHGIDLVLLVVAADDGVMPQTEEHLDILHLLGVSHGIVVITKADLVDAARLAVVEEDVEILLAGTTLEGAPIVPVSSTTGAGIDVLRTLIESRLAGYQRTAPTGYFRLPVDRAFVMHGHGTVVTGTAVGGSVRPGDLVRLLPGGAEARVRTVQVHGADVAAATFGQRVALNLAGIERVEVRRGHVVCDRRLDRTTTRIDAWVEIRPAAKRPVKSHEDVRLYVGTAEVLGRIVLLDGADQLAPRHTAPAQLVLREPVHALRSDRFILRNQSAQRTLGGGVVVHPFAPRHRRSEPVQGLLDALYRAADAPAVVRALLAIEPAFALTPEFIAQAGNLAPEDVRAAVRDDPQLRVFPSPAHPAACTTTDKWARLCATVTDTLTAFHTHTPLAPGMEMESLRTQVAADLTPKVFREVLDALVAERVVARADSILRLPTHRVALKHDEEEVAGRAEALLAAGGVTPPDLKQLETTLKVPRTRLQAILQQLEREGRVTKVADGLYFAREPVERARALLRTHALVHGEISAAAFRDLLDASRKFSIALLDYFDRTGFTLRVGDIRKLRNPER
jgi:selenocysteine-specific elongation factor